MSRPAARPFEVVEHDPAWAETYSVEKARLAPHRNDRLAYTEAKHPFITRILEQVSH